MTANADQNARSTVNAPGSESRPGAVTRRTLHQAIASGQHLLPEDEGKALLASYGIAIPKGRRVLGLDRVEIEAVELPFPVVAKALVSGAPHKTELGAVRVGIDDAKALWATVTEFRERFPGEPLLVEEMVGPGADLIAGLINDKHFGPTLMVGLGGVFAEVFQDVQFLLLPASNSEIKTALGALKGYPLLTGFRGSAPADIDQLMATLQCLASFGLEMATYYESVDINPLRLGPEGPIALDVKVMLKAEIETAGSCHVFASADAHSSAGASPLATFLAPRSVAVVGASPHEGKPGNVVIRNLIANGYPGKIYLVNPRGGEILGLPVYPAVHELPPDVDLAVIIVPAKHTPAALREVAEHGIKHAVLSAGGFAETDQVGERIQQELLDIIKQFQIHVLGPNTSGHTSTPANFTSTFFPLGKIRRGNVAYVAQTGNFATFTMKYIMTAEYFGVSRVLGLGNKIDIDESQALDYLRGDPETAGILLYLESIKNPRRFLNLARQVTPHKPVVMLKSGTTEAGKKAAAAHTAALASEDRLVEGLVQQAGIVRLTNYSDLIMAGKVLSACQLPAGRQIAFLAPSGAMLVCLSDLSTRLGLQIPELQVHTRERIQEITPSFIRIRNPVDIWAAAMAAGIQTAYSVGMEALLDDPNVDAVVPILMLTRETGTPQTYDFVVDLARRYPKKPVLVSFTGDKECMDECREFLEPRGVCTFTQIEEPFQALSILCRCAEAAKRNCDAF